MNATSQKPLVLITGASSGIGHALALTFAQAGYSLGVIARNKAALENLNLPMTQYITADVTDFSSIQQGIHHCERQFGPVHGLINNAGYCEYGEFTTITPEAHQTIIQTNITGILNSTKIVLPSMQNRKQGTIINISSLADRHPRPLLATYAASKAAVKSLTESLRMANAKYGIRFCNVAPAKITSPMTVISDLAPEQMIAATSFAEMILWIYQQPAHICIRDMVIAPTLYEP